MKRVSPLMFLLFASCASTPHIAANGEATPVSVVDTVEIRGVRQFISIRGSDIRNPLLVFLHGGPGTAVMPLSRTYNGELEKHFIVVNWDQRGAGRSTIHDGDYATLTMDDFVEDAYRLIQILCERHGKSKVYVMGHSWGSLVGMMLARKHPDVVQKFYSIGQLVDVRISEQRAYEYLLAHATGEQRRLLLQEVGPPETGWYRAGYDGFRKARNLLLETGGVLYQRTSFSRLVVSCVLSREYGPLSIPGWLRGSQRSLEVLWPGIVTKANLFQDAPELKVPVVFLVGRHDHNADSGLTEEYYRALKAEKKIYWFEASGHAPNYEESERFNRIVISEK